MNLAISNEYGIKAWHYDGEDTALLDWIVGGDTGRCGAPFGRTLSGLQEEIAREDCRW